MQEIDYNNYYWQDDLVRLRAANADDWEFHHYNRFDTPSRLLLDYLVELPPTIKESQEKTAIFADFDQSTGHGRGRFMFAAETLDGNTVGWLNLNSIDERNGTFSIGMQIDGRQRGKGYGTAAMRIVLRYAFLERRLNKYNGSVLDGNIASATMLKKLGCVQEGVRRQIIYSGGKYHDEILFGLTKDEFLQVK